MSVSEKMTAIADAIRLKTGDTELLTLDDMALKIPEVYIAGYEKGKLDDGNSNFWDIYQDYGNRTDYSYAFRNTYWTNELFNPKYKMYPQSARYMFCFSKISDYDKIAQYVDFSNTTSFGSVFANNTLIKHLPALSPLKAVSADSAFAGATNLVQIDKLIINTDGTFPFDKTTFNSCQSLEEIRFEGVIGVDFNIQYSSKLSKDSIISIFEALSSSTSALSATFSKAAVNRAFASGTSTSNGSTSEEWAALIATKPNWTVNLI